MKTFSIGVVSDENSKCCEFFRKMPYANIELHIIDAHNAHEFDLIILEALPKTQIYLKENATVIVSDTDENINKLFKNQSLRIISCGLSGKASVGISSRDDERSVVCILRSISTLSGGSIVPQEFTLEHSTGNENVFLFLASVTAFLLCDVTLL